MAAIAPQFGQGRTVAVKPQEVEGGKKKFPTWAWYAGGAVIGIAILMFFRGQSTSGTSTGTATGSPLVGTPTSDAAQIGNLTAAVQAATANMTQGTTQGTSANGVPVTNTPTNLRVVRGLDSGGYYSVGGGLFNPIPVQGAFSSDTFLQSPADAAGNITVTGVGKADTQGQAGLYTSVFNPTANTWTPWAKDPQNASVLLGPSSKLGPAL